MADDKDSGTKKELSAEDEKEARKETTFKQNSNWRLVSGYLAIVTLLLIIVLIQLTPDVCTSCEEKPAKFTITPMATAEVTLAATAEATSSVSISSSLESPPEATQPPVASPTPDPDADFRPHTYNFLWGTILLSKESRLALLALIIGALGGLVHSLRSLSDYVGTRGFKNQWTLSYVLRPFSSGGLALIAYLLIRGGFFSNGLDAADKYKLLALSGLIGLFSEQTITKLRQIANTVFSIPTERSDPLPQSKDQSGNTVVTDSSASTDNG